MTGPLAGHPRVRPSDVVERVTLTTNRSVGKNQPNGWYNMSAPLPWVVATSFGHAVLASFRARLGPHRGWPSETLLLDEPLALAEEKTSRLRRIYSKAAENLWDGNAVFRDAVSRHGKIGLSREARIALAHPISMLTWGELAAWIVSAELAERLDDPDARMAASSQVFDEARHFYVLRDYLAFLHVPIPRIDPSSRSQFARCSTPTT